METNLEAFEKLMSSREIAELTEKEHKNVMADIREIERQLGQLISRPSSYINLQNKEQPMLLLDKENSLLVVSGYSVAVRRKIIQRWQELERAPQFKLPQNYKEALLALVTEVDKNERLALENNVMKPKAQFFDAVTGSCDVVDMATVAKVLHLGFGRNKLFSFLRLKGILNASNRPYQTFIDRGLFRLVETSYTTPDGTAHVSIKTVVFQKGIDFISKLVKQNQQLLSELDD